MRFLKAKRLIAWITLLSTVSSWILPSSWVEAAEIVIPDDRTLLTTLPPELPGKIGRFAPSLAALAVTSGQKVPQSPGEGPSPRGVAKALFQADLFTGQATVRIPLQIPPGRQGIEPELALTYRSGDPDGWVGLGWSLELGIIQRSTKRGVPTYDDSKDIFTVSFQGVQGELVPIGGDTYQLKREGSFWRIRYVRPYWELTTKDGTRFFFGLDPTARQENPKGIFAWMLTKVQDLHGNTMQLSYTSNQGQLYLSEIQYTGFEPTGELPPHQILFTLENRPVERTGFLSGAKIVTAKRLRDVSMFAQGTLARKYVLSYGSTFPHPLSQITEYGNDGVTSLPPVTLSYYSAVPGLLSGTSWPGVDAQGGSSLWGAVRYAVLGLPGLGTTTKVELRDMDGDARPDRVLNPAPGSSAFKVQLNTGSAFSSAINWTGVENPVALQESRSFLSPSGWILATYVDLIDMNGDGRPDRIFQNPTTPSDQWMVQLNTGNGFSPSVAWLGVAAVGNPWWGASELTRMIRASWLSSSGATNAVVLDLLDMNGDGLPDRVIQDPTSSASVTRYHVQLNTGSGFSLPVAWPGVAHPGGSDFARTGIRTATSQMTTDMVDMNGDGLLDRVMQDLVTPFDRFHVQLNNGNGFEPVVDWVPVSGEVSGDFWRLLRGDSTVALGSESGKAALVDLVDLNGDRLPDRVLLGQPVTANPNSYAIQRNTGQGFLPFEYITNVTNPFAQATRNSPRVHMGFNDVKTVVDFFDIDGNGLPDRVLQGVAPYDTFWVQKTPTVPSLLFQVNNGVGGVTAITYRPSATFQNTGSDGIPDLPFPNFVVSQASVFSGLQSFTTRYTYADGAYDPAEREFRGFGRVTVTDPDGNPQENFFHQDGARAGKPYRQEVKNSAGNLFSRTENTWTRTDPAPGVTFSPLTQTDAFTFDGDATFKQTRTVFQYDSYGNETERREEGEVSVSGDERTTRTEYVINPTLHLADRVSKVQTLDALGIKVSEQQRLYDDHTSPEDPPTRGLLTQQTDWLSTGPPDPVQGFAYDVYGNQILAVDPRNGSTSTRFDDVLHIYPIEVTNPLSHRTRQTYDPKTGEILTTIDPNGQTTTNVYDPLGRLTQVIGPLDTPLAPGILYEYALASAPTRITKSVRIQPGGPDFFATHTFFDGLDRAVEVKSPAEDPARQIISGVATFDGRGNVRERYHAQFVPNTGSSYTPLDSTWPKTAFTYDAANRKVNVTHPDGTIRTTGYQDWTVTETDENGHITRRAFDAFQRLAQVEEVNGAQVYTTRYAYDALGRLIQATDAKGNVTRMSYDSLGRRLSVEDPDRGAWSFSYDLSGNLTRQTDAKGRILNLTYDALNRLTLKSSPSFFAFFTYDDSAQPNRVGRLSKVTDGSGSTEFFYDPLGREVKQVKIVSGVNFTSQRTYDALERFTSITYPNGEAIQYTYNAQGQVETIASGAVQHLTNTDYSATQQRTRVAFANGTATDYTYDPLTLRLNRLVTSGPAGALQDFVYTYDNVGNIKRIQDTVGSNTQDFLYDDLDRLVRAAGSYGTETYTYDSIANLTAHNGTQLSYGLPNGSKPHALTSPAAGQTFTYDANGNLSAKTNTTFSYDAENRLIQAASDEEITVVISLRPGWNFFSLPVVPQDLKINQVLSGLAFGNTGYDQVSRWNPDTQTFEQYVNDPAYNHFDTFEYGRGYEIFVTHPSGITVTLRGRAPSQSTSLSLKPSWGLVGSPAAASISVSQALNPLVQGADYQQAARYKPTTGTWEFAPPAGAQTGFTTVAGGEAYFVKMLRNVTWVIPPQAGPVTFTYDGQGNRVKKTTVTSTTRYIGEWMEQAVTAGDTFTRNRIFLDSTLIAVKEIHTNGSPAQTLFMQSDHLGSTGVVTDAAGQVAQRTTYLPYGLVSTETGSLTLPEKFTGKRLDKELGLYDYGARSYDPAFARFLTPDTAGPSYSDPQTLNPYAYTRNNPVKLKDPTGEGFWLYLLDIVGTASDIYFTATDVVRYFQEPTVENLKAVGSDIGFALIPFASVGAVKLGAQTGELAASASRRAGELSGELASSAKRVAAETEGASRFVPNPGGRLGDNLTKGRTAEAIKDLEQRGLRPDTEVQFRPPGQKKGVKGSRFADVVGRDPKTGEIKEIVQIGRTTKAGEPIARERRAIDDIRRSDEFQKARDSVIRFIDKISGRSL